MNKPIALLLDMDGVLFHGERPLPGAADFIEAISSLPHLFITNNPILPPEGVAEKFQRIGLPQVSADLILTSAAATARYLSGRTPGFRYFAVGERGLHLALQAVGTEDAERADYVVVGEGKGLDYQSLTTGINLILQQGAELIATNPDHNVDAYLDGHHRILPGGGALVAPFAVATGRTPVFIGKPNPLLYELALQQLGVDAAHCIMVGDRPDTDILGAQRLGMRSALVRSGRFAPGEPLPTGVAPPEWDVDDLATLLQCWSEVLS